MMEETPRKWRCNACGKEGAGRFFYNLHWEDCAVPAWQGPEMTEVFA